MSTFSNSAKKTCPGGAFVTFPVLCGILFFRHFIQGLQELTRVNAVPPDIAALWPFALYAALVVLLLVVMLAASHFLGQRHRERATDEPYESGVASTGSARVRFDVKFYLVAMFFLIFDLESVFIYTWAVSLRENGWPGYIVMAIFIAALAAALVYLWRRGALDWGKRKPSKP
jgi:NADH-quinone oxidoreductase subunit A